MRTDSELKEDVFVDQVSNAMSLTRRGACSLAAGLSVGAFAGIGGARAVIANAAAPEIRYVVTDRRYSESLIFGATLMEFGAARLEVTDGLTRLWSEALAPLWQGKSGAVAGLTLSETWAGLAEQARSDGRRSVLIGHHVLFEGENRRAHNLTLTQASPGIVPALERSGDAWQQVMAKFAAHYSCGGHRIANARHRSAAYVSAPVSLALTSWIIA